MGRLMLCVMLVACATNGLTNDNEVDMPQNIDLPEPRLAGTVSLEETVAQRRSIRSFAADTLTLEQTGQLLWAGQGITDESRGLRAPPSAGATYPMTLYLVNAQGIFRYEPEPHRLSTVRTGDHRGALQRAALNQSSVGGAPVNIVVVAQYTRTTGRYGERGVRYVHIEAGHVAQNIHLQAVAEGLGSVPIGAFSDDEVRNVLELGDDLTPLYVIPVGHAAN